MLPLFLVYVAEYTINQGVAPTLLFPLASSPFKHYRAFYPAYNALYQLGVFISRSSLPFVRVRTLYTPTLLQVLNLCLLTAHALWPFLPGVWWVFVVVFWEGLLGGEYQQYSCNRHKDRNVVLMSFRPGLRIYIRHHP